MREAKDLESDLSAQVLRARDAGTQLCIRGSGSKDFYGGSRVGEIVCTAAHRGILRYDPTELVLTARAGTDLTEIENALNAQGQMLGFEPPRFGGRGSLGGAVASGLSGARRPFVGAVRDFVLGVKLINGNGEVLGFGGEVMKNVAGFDCARLQAGALGSLGLLLQISLRVLPRPPQQRTLVIAQPEPESARALFQSLAAQPLPLSGFAWYGGETRIRLSGSREAITDAQKTIASILKSEKTAPAKPQSDTQADQFWQQLRDQQLPFFTATSDLLRVSLPASAPTLLAAGAQSGEVLEEWGGALRWVRGRAGLAELRAAAAQFGGHVTRFRSAAEDTDADPDEHTVFTPLPPALHAIHRQLKSAFDPHGIFNPRRLYPDF